MGNWRTVQIIGEVKDKNEIKSIIKYLTVLETMYDYSSPAREDDIYYLQFGKSLCGLNQWIKSNGKINIVGNLFERDCSINNLENELKILADKFKSLDFILHAGGEYEDLICVVSFLVNNGIVKREQPMVKEIDKIDDDRIAINMYRALGIKL